MRSSRSSGSAAAWLVRGLIVVVLAWVLVPIAASTSQAAFTGSTVMASAYGGRDVTGGTTYAQSAYPTPPTASNASVVLGLITLGAMNSAATADPLADTATSSADAGGLAVKVGVVEVLSLADAHAQCYATPTGVTGAAQAGGLKLLGLALNNIPAVIPANYTIQQTNLIGQNTGYIVLNEQITYPTTGGQYQLEVNGAHIVNKTAGTNTVTSELILAHAECGSTAPITPTITSVSPNQGPETGGTTVTVTGTNFLAVTAVKFGTANPTSYTVDSLTQITAVAPAGTGAADLKVTNVAGTNANTAADDYTYVPKPTVTQVSPASGPTSGGTTVVITGTNFTNVTAVRFGATAASSFVRNSATQITAVAPVRAAGQIDVTVTAIGGTSDAVTADQYTYVAPPTVTNVSPSSGPLAAGTSVTITGSGFTGASAVRFGATNAVGYTVNGATQITAVAPAGGAGTVDVTVTTVGGTSATSASDQYTYVAAPTVTAVSPVSGPTTAGTSVVITGTNLTGASAVRFGANPATSVTVNSATQITATAPAGGAGTVDVTVTTVGGTSATSSADQYTYVTGPVVTAVSPARGPLAGGTTVVVTGTGFTAASSVRFGASNATSYVVNSAFQITAVAPAGAAGTVDVTVTTVGGTSATSTADQYVYVAAPTVTGLAPAAGPIAGGTSVTVTGTGFTGATSVAFGGVSTTSFTVSGDTQLVVTAPAQAVGTVDVVVTAPGGTSATSSADRFTYYAVPTVTAVSPASGPTGAGTVVVITGTGFTGASGVRFGANPATSFTVNSGTQITATAPAGSVGTVDVTVTTPGGTSAPTSADQFTYVGPPVVSAVSPARGPLGGGQSVVITGAGFTGATTVRFGASNAASYVVNSATQITAVTPAGSAGTVDVTVTTVGGTSATSSSDQYSYVNAPTVSAISPSAGPVGGGTTVTVTGTGFTGATSVSFGGVPAAGVIAVSSDTSITAVAPAHVAGPVDVTVTAPGGVSATVAADRFTYVDPPVVTGISPAGGPTAGSVSQVITITGTDFTGATAVTFDGYPPLAILGVTATQIQVRGVPPHATGPVHIQVTTPYGTSAQNPADVYTYQGPPTLTSVSPASGPLAGGGSTVLTGTGFSTATAVSFGPQNASYTVDSDTRITAVVPTGSAGPVNVTVMTAYGTSNASSYTYVAAPAVTSVSPASGPVTGSTLVTVNGTGFTGVTAVAFGGVAATGVTVSSDTLITAYSPAAPGGSAGPVDVTVTTVGGTSAAVAADLFTYVAAPVVTALTPSSGPAAGGTTVVITGTSFSAATAVTFGGTAAASFTVNSGTQITAVAPAHTAGTVDVSVTAIGGTSAPVTADRYTFVVAPGVTAVAPAAGPLAGGNPVVVTGTGFTGTSLVSFGATAAPSFTVDSPTQITAVAPAGPAGVADVRVTTVGGTSAVVPADRYTYQAVPVVTGLSPDHGPVAGGTLVAVTGSGFSGATSVTFGGVPASGVIAVSNDGQIVATAPAHVEGVVDVVVTAPGGVSSGFAFRYVGAPTVTGTTPVNGPVVGGTTVVVTGTGFTTVTGPTAVQFGGNNAASYTVDSDTRITAVTPAHAAGPVGVTVTTGDGGTSAVTASDTFTYIGVPGVTAISPGSGPTAGGTVVTITGTGLSTATSVRFGGVSAGFTVNSDTQVTATAPAGAAGLADVTVTTVGGTSATSAAGRFRYVGTPTVSGIAPAAGPVAGGTQVVITGGQFHGVTGVTFGGSAATFTVDSPTQVTASAPAHAAGAVDVRVATADGGISAAGTVFTYVADPVVTGLAPTSGPVAGGTTVVISGSGFSGATDVRFGSVAASFVVNGGTQITAVAPAQGVGTVDVTVTGPFATSATSPADRFSYAAPPVIASVSPGSGPLAGGNQITLSGSGFTLTSAVTLGGVAGSVQFVSPTQLTVTVPPGGAGPVDVVVTTPYGQDQLTGGYRYRAAPSVTSVVPGAGPQSGGTTVVITGTGFTDATAVRFGATPATLFTVSSDTSITATAPSGAGTVDVTVTGPGGTSATSGADRYRYAVVPVIASLAPGFGPVAGGTSVTVTGTGFTGATALTLGGVPVAFAVVDDSTVTFTAPGGSGDVTLTVTTPGGTSGPAGFTYADAPAITVITPGAGPVTGGNTVTVDGTGFTTGSTVTFGGVPAASLQYVSGTRLRAVAPAGTGTQNIVVTTPYGTSPGEPYRYVAEPVVNVVQPGAGPLGGGTTVTLTGTGFTDVTAVRFGTTPATSFTVNGDTSITAVAPAHAAGSVDVTVTSPGGTSATSAADRFSYLVAPVLTSLAPSSGPVGGGSTVVLTGTGFTPDSAVTFGGVAAGSVQYVSPTQLQVVTPAGAAAGPVLVRVSTPGGSDSGLFTYRQAPSVGGIQPVTGPEAGGTTVTITGTDLSGATAVSFGGTPAAAFTVSSDSRIVATAPAGTGTVHVRVTGPGGTSATSSDDEYRYAPAPSVSGLSPTSGPAAGGTTLALIGSGFTGAGSVTIGGVAVPFVVDRDASITLTTPPAAAGNADVVVTTPGGTSAPMPFLYVDPPVVSALSPDAGPLGGGTAVTVTGSGFTAASTVSFGGVAAASVQYVSPVKLVAVSPSRGSAGVVGVVVASEYGSSVAGTVFTYTMAPTVTSLSPGAGPLAGGTTVTIGGSGLTGASAVTFDGVAAASFVVNGDASVTAVTPAGSVGNAVVRVTTVGGSDTGVFRYANVPAVSSVSPVEGPEAGGTVVTIDGSGFTGATAVTFGSSAAGFTVSSDTRITATAPAGTATVDVLVTAPGGTSAGGPGSRFRYAPVPVVGQLSPASGPVVGGTVVTLTGSGFSGTSGVTVGGAPVSFTVVDGSTITVTMPAGSAGTAPVVVTTPGGDSVAVQFTYVDQPVLSAVSPSVGPLSGGATVTVSGTGLTGASAVTFDGVPASFVVNGDTSITAVTPPGVAGAAVVRVTTVGGSATTGFTYADEPAVTQVQPGTGPVAGATPVVIDGSGFTGATVVRFGIVTAVFTVTSDTRITATAPAQAAGTVDVTVTTPGGTSAVSPAGRYRYAAVPTAGTVGPDTGPLGGGTAVTLSGSGFTGATGVTIDGVPVPFTVNDDSTITFTTPTGTAGAVDIVVTTPGGSSVPVRFTYVNAPAITAVSPDEGPIAGGTLVTLTGTGFGGATAVEFDGVPANGFVVNSATEIQARTPAHAAGGVGVNVTAPGGVSNNGTFTYRAAPVIASLSPGSGPVAGGTAVTVTGSGFTGAGNVTIDGNPVAHTVVDDSTVTFTTPSGQAGTVTVAISTAGGSAGTGFTYADAPAVTALSPAAGPLAGGTAVTITGTGFTLASTVRFGADPAASVQFTGPTELIAVSPTATGPGVVDVVVATGYGDSGTSGTENDFEYTDSALITGVNPGSGPLGGGNAVTVSGSGFVGITDVTFGGLPAPSFTVNSATELTAVVPAHGTGAVDVRITGTGGTSPITPAGRYTYLDAPTVSSLAPDAGPVAGGTTITVTGTGFTTGSVVTFGGNPSGTVQFVSGNQLTVTSPAHPAGVVDVVVTTPGGSSAAGHTFEYLTAPVVSGLTPSTGPVSGGTPVSISGSGFTPTSTVTFGAQPASSVTFVSVNRVDAVSPATVAAGPVDVVVTTGGGQSAPDPFTYRARPVVNVVQPGSGPVAGGTPVAITGTGFTAATQVWFGTDAATAFSVDSDTRITATSPAGSGVVDVTVRTPGGTSDLSVADRFTYRPAPQITGLAPASGPAAGGTVVILTGSGFTGATEVAVGGVPVPFTVNGDGGITLTVPAGAVGPESVRVTTPGGAASTGYEYLNTPGITGVSPSSGPVTGGTTVTLRGSGFAGATAVTFGSVAAASFTVDAPDRITAVAPAHAAGPVGLTVTTPAGTSAAEPYTYLAPPVVTGVAPVSGPVAGGTTVMIRGTGLAGASDVTFEGVAAASFVVVDPQTVTAVTPPNPAGPADVVVTTPGGGSAPGRFTYVPVPLVVTLDPSAGPTEGGTVLTVGGSGLAGGTVTVDGVPVTPDSASDTAIVIRTPAHPAGPVDVVVTTVGGTSRGTFTYVAPRSAPVLSSVTPASGPEAGGTTVTLTGVRLTGATSVLFGTVGASFTVVDDATITATVPAGSAGPVPVSVITPDGTSSGTVTYVYVAQAVAPTVTAVTPAVGPVAGGTRVTVTGSGFDGRTTVTFDGVPGTGIELGAATAGFRMGDGVPDAIRAAASTSLTVLTPAHAEGPAEVVVGNTAGSDTAPDDFTYVPVLGEATISMQVEVNTTTAVAPQGSLYAGLEVASCSAPTRGDTSVGTGAAFCRYSAPGTVGQDAFTMQVVDVLGQRTAQDVRVTVIDSGQGGEGTGGGGGNEGDGGGDGGTGGEGSGTGGGGGNDTDGGTEDDTGRGGGGGTGSGGGGGGDTGKGNPGHGNQGDDQGDDGGSHGTGGSGGNDERGDDGKGGGVSTSTPTPSGQASARPSGGPSVTPAASPSTPSTPSTSSSPGAGQDEVTPVYLLPLLAGLAGLLLLVALLWLGWWWFLAARRRRRQEDEDQPASSR
ncbi:IPT/TIG domain-containing protein [Kineosporia sp. J2-2]|uniref:IPT/TIG domain-containing protein n=1 Tax=Kineosporia corallincola TaxID=2835133 RepID=A0ABS5THV2_9ACTN|nr:IPT/TIG domain-containing protein [Kineosporia corallincola]MBT0770667.1 IPT/TIG domain-containing protein [Kineosporia corallincola]